MADKKQSFLKKQSFSDIKKLNFLKNLVSAIVTNKT
jgi:hypothetical protein